MRVCTCTQGLDLALGRCYLPAPTQDEGATVDKKTLVRAIAVSAMGFGAVAVMAPDALLRTYGFGSNPEARGLMRGWGTRTFALGALSLRAEGRELDHLIAAGVLLNGADAVLGFAGNALNGSTGSGASRAGATSAAFAGLEVLARKL